MFIKSLTRVPSNQGIGYNNHKKIQVNIMNSTSKPASKNTPEIRLSELPGIDIKRGLITTQNNHALYLRLADKFKNKQQDFIEQFKQSLNQSLEDAERIAHSLKGNAGNLGMHNLFEYAKELEFACKNKQDSFEPELQQVGDELDIVIASIETLLRNVQEPASEPVQSSNSDTANIVPLIKELVSLLTENNIKSASVIKQLQPLMANTTEADTVQSIIEHIDDYEFQDALEVLTLLAEKLNIKVS